MVGLPHRLDMTELKKQIIFLSKCLEFLYFRYKNKNQSKTVMCVHVLQLKKILIYLNIIGISIHLVKTALNFFIAVQSLPRSTFLCLCSLCIVYSD